MIQLRFRPWDWTEWTEVTIEGPDGEDAIAILGSWAFVNNFEIEALNGGGEWVALGEWECS